MVPTDKVTVTANGDKLKVVNPNATILRHACSGCGVHMHGPVEKDHAFKGLSFIHPERFKETGWAPPGFAAFVSSVIELGTRPSEMAQVRARLKELGLEPYDCLESDAHGRAGDVSLRERRARCASRRESPYCILVPAARPHRSCAAGML